MLTIYGNCDKRRLQEIVTWDDTLLHFDEPERLGNKISFTKQNKRPTIAKRLKKRQGKFCNFIIMVQLFGFPSKDDKSVTKGVYIYKISFEVQKYQKIRRPKSGIRGVKLLHDDAPGQTAK